MKKQGSVQNPSLHIAEFTHNPPSEEALHRITNSKLNSVQIVNMLLFAELNTNNYLLLWSLRRHLKILIHVSESSVVIEFNWDEVLIIQQTNKHTNKLRDTEQPELVSVFVFGITPCCKKGFPVFAFRLYRN
jgi:hypothetical protein